MECVFSHVFNYVHIFHPHFFALYACWIPSLFEPLAARVAIAIGYSPSDRSLIESTLIYQVIYQASVLPLLNSYISVAYKQQNIISCLLFHSSGRRVYLLPLHQLFSRLFSFGYRSTSLILTVFWIKILTKQIYILRVCL